MPLLTEPEVDALITRISGEPVPLHPKRHLLRRPVVPADKAAKPGRASPPCGPIGDDPINRLAG